MRQLCALRERIIERLCAARVPDEGSSTAQNGQPAVAPEERRNDYWERELRALDDFAASRGYKLT